MPEIIRSKISVSPSGKGQELELLKCLPIDATTKPPVLFIHGAYCSAHDFQYFLPHFASNGHPAYALSLRGHGSSFEVSGLTLQLFTTVAQHTSDIRKTLVHIHEQHPGLKPIVCGHSFGGGYLQALLSQEGEGGERLVSGLVLLGSAPIYGGGKEIVHNWEMVETHGKGHDYPWSPRSQLNTAQQVREAFFSDDTSEETIELWRTTCRTEKESIRTGLAVFWPFGEAGKVLRAIEGLGDGRKMLFVSAGNDKLVKDDITAKNVEAYRAEDGGKEEALTEVTIQGSGHHMMMDTPWRECADAIIEWARGAGAPRSSFSQDPGLDM